MNLGQWLIIGLSAILVVWYIGANVFNRRRGIMTYQWLRRGLEHLGEITESRWLGSSGTGGRLFIAQANKPFRQLEAIFLLETREILPYWIVTHLRGKRDEVTIRANLRSSPKSKIEISPHNDLAVLDKTSKDPVYEIYQINGMNVTILEKHRMETDQIIDGLQVLMSKTGDFVHTISLQKKEPHLTVRVSVKPFLESSPDLLFTALKSWLQS